jgi:hypothetical protein
VLLPAKAAELFDRIAPYAPFLLVGLIYLGVISAITYPLQRLLSLIIHFVISVVL